MRYSILGVCLEEKGYILRHRFYGFAGLIVTLIVLLCGGCKDPISIADFIEQNTSIARVITWEIDEDSKIMVGSDGYRRLAFKETWNDETEDTLVFYIDPGEPPNYKEPKNIELTLAIINPQGYSLRLVPDYRVYDPENIQLYPYDEFSLRENDNNRQRKVTVEQTSATTALLSISNAIIGERYEIRLNVSMNDGSRIFETYTDIPSVVFNTLLNGPRNMNLYAAKEGGV